MAQRTSSMNCASSRAVEQQIPSRRQAAGGRRHWISFQSRFDNKPRRENGKVIFLVRTSTTFVRSPASASFVGSRPIPQPQTFPFSGDFVTFLLRFRDVVGGQESRRDREGPVPGGSPFATAGTETVRQTKFERPRFSLSRRPSAARTI